MAAELRKDLFAKMMVQDMAFFDTHKTQDIISRLTLDVQEFKSSFKQVVSQGMKYIFCCNTKYAFTTFGYIIDFSFGNIKIFHSFDFRSAESNPGKYERHETFSHCNIQII